MEMAKIGPGIAGGNNRQTVTDEDGEGRHLFKRWCDEAGLTIGVDEMGTMFARREGTDPDALPVYVGSHLDTQPTGGKYDGVLGVLGGLEIVRTLNDLGIRTKHPIVVTNWTNEEGARFAPAMMASARLCRHHHAGLCLWAQGQGRQAVRRGTGQRIGWKGDETVGARKMHAFFELHIEQGPILEDEGIDIGVVTHGQGLKWLQVTLTGREAHTGSTPMPKRRNAGLGMARVIELVHEIAMDYQPRRGRRGRPHGSLSELAQHHRRPDRLHRRHPLAGKGSARRDGRSASARASRRSARRSTSTSRSSRSAISIPVTFDEGCVKAIRDAAERLGYSHRDIVSGAGHDACWINRVAPTAMVMCPCVDGLSATTRPRRSIRNGRRRAATCCFMRWWRRR